LLKMRSELVLLKSQIKPLREDLDKRRAEESEKDKECVVVESKWWW